MTILITGSEGLIGTALLERFKKQNIQVLRFDKKFSKGHPSYGDILDEDLLNVAINEWTYHVF